MKLYELQIEVTPKGISKTQQAGRDFKRTKKIDVPDNFIDVEDFAKKALKHNLFNFDKNGNPRATNDTYKTIGDIGFSLKAYKKFLDLVKEHFPENRINDRFVALDLAEYYIDNKKIWKQVLAAVKGMKK